MEFQNYSDEELVRIYRKNQNNSESIFRELVTRHKDYVYSIALQKLKNTLDAQDASQETFIRVYHGIKNFREDSSFKTWLTVITGNVCLSMLLTEKNRFWKYHVSLQGDVNLESIYNSMISKQQEFEFWRKIGEILYRMFNTYRKVFIFKYFKDYTLKLISDKINATLAATKMKVKRAKDQFIKIFIRG